MKIRVALLDNDINYLNRLVMVFNTRYADKLELRSFTTKENAMMGLKQEKIDVIIANETFEINPEEIPKYCGFAYFVDSVGVEKVKGQRAVCKFQKAELIYKQILNIYADKAAVVTGKKGGESTCQSIFFTSFSGGVGCSSMAAALAVRIAQNHQKVLYLNLEKLGDPEVFFQGEGQLGLSDVIYAIKSKKSNLQMKIESVVKTSVEGVDYFAAPKMALDFMELKVDEVSELLDVTEMCGYQYVIIDAGFCFDDMSKMLWRKSDEVIIVADGNKISNSKLERAYHSLKEIQNQDEMFRLEKASLIYNGFSNKNCKTITGLDINEIGGISRFEHIEAEQLIRQLSTMSVLDKIIL